MNSSILGAMRSPAANKSALTLLNPMLTKLNWLQISSFHPTTLPVFWESTSENDILEKDSKTFPLKSYMEVKSN